MKAPELRRGAIAWMAGNPVAANLLMAVMLVGGAVTGTQIKQEVFPEFDMDYVGITVAYPGASPTEVEEGIVLSIEEAVRGVDGVKRVIANASEGVGSVTAELLLGVDQTRVTADIKNAVDRVTSLPQDAEEPIVRLLTNRREVISLVIYGGVDERVLKEFAETARSELLAKEGITTVELAGVRPTEISIEVPQAKLREYALTLGQIAQEVRRASIDLPGGGVKTASGEVLLRTTERRDYGGEFADLTLRRGPSGSEVKLGDVATVIDGFADNDQESYFDGKPAVMVQVFRVGDQTPIEVADVVKRFRAEFEDRLPPGVGVATWMDWSEIYRDRIDLLMRNAYLGLFFVLLVLGLFLKPRLAFWVTMGIPISFMGSLLLMPAMDASFNMLSLFAFIVTLGMVVDDAIVVGENVHELREQGMKPLQAAIVGAKEIATPVIFSIMTTVAAFMPMFFIPGFMGKIFGVMPVIVVSVLLLSLVESLLVLPAHLGHERMLPQVVRVIAWVVTYPLRPLGWVFMRANRWVRDTLQWFIRRVYKPSVALAVEYRYVTVAIGLATFFAVLGLGVSGRLQFTFMPKIESDRVQAVATLPYGSAVADTREVMERLLAGAHAVLAQEEGEISRGVFAQVGATPRGGGPAGGSSSGGHLTGVQVFLVPVDQRRIKATEFVRKWRETVGEIPGLESLAFKFNIGPSAGDPISVQLSHPSIEVLERAATEVAKALEEYSGVKDIDDGRSPGKPQLDMRVAASARQLGVTATDMAAQFRGAFFGSEAARQQRGRDELRVYVRLPKAERTSEHHVETFILRTPGGGEVPLAEAAEVDRGRAYTSISREDGRRVVTVTADIDAAQGNAREVLAGLGKDVMPSILAKYPSLAYSFEGEQREMRESLGSLGLGYLLALLVMYALIAIPFKSYIQPVVVMTAIPFGVVGAFLGHALMGYDLSLISMLGIVALSGVVVNDSLVLVATANRYRENGMSAYDAIVAAGARRFRPILLTSVTTFLGLAPMIFETSVQARFLIPMAISLGYGVVFSTFIILMIVPSTYMIVEDAKRALGVSEIGEHDALEDEEDGEVCAPVAPA